MPTFQTFFSHVNIRDPLPGLVGQGGDDRKKPGKGIMGFFILPPAIREGYPD